MQTLNRLVVEIGDVAAAAMKQVAAAAADTCNLGKNRTGDGRILALNIRQPYAEAIVRGQRSFHDHHTATQTRAGGSTFMPHRVALRCKRKRRHQGNLAWRTWQARPFGEG